MKNLTHVLVLILVLCGTALTACQPATPEKVQDTPTLAPTETPEPTKGVALWQVIGEPKAPLLTLLVGFNDASFGIAIGEDGVASYTHDGGQTWSEADNISMGLYGLDIVNEQVAFACGTGSTIRVTTDGGASWQEAENFGGTRPAHCRFMSFSNPRNGWAATPTILGGTADGGAAWTTTSLPVGVTSIAAISLSAPGRGYLLDISGTLYATSDDGLTWTQAGKLPLGEVTIDDKSFPVAAMYFQGAKRGTVVISAIVGGAGQVVAFHTTDGGQTWSQEIAAATYGATYLSRDGRFLTLFMQPTKVTVLQYNGE